MADKLNRQSYERLIAEDIEFLHRLPHSLERDHIELVLRNSVYSEYEIVPSLQERNRGLVEQTKLDQLAIESMFNSGKRLEAELAQLRGELQDEPLAKDVAYIRCMRHRAIPQLNSNELSGSECGACIEEEIGLLPIDAAIERAKAEMTPQRVEKFKRELELIEQSKKVHWDTLNFFFGNLQAREREVGLPDVEVVAALVHESWMEQKRLNGFTSAISQQTGEEQMRDYRYLSETVKEYDRATVRAVYKALAQLNVKAELKEEASAEKPDSNA